MVKNKIFNIIKDTLFFSFKNKNKKIDYEMIGIILNIFIIHLSLNTIKI